MRNLQFETLLICWEHVLFRSRTAVVGAAGKTFAIGKFGLEKYRWTFLGTKKSSDKTGDFLARLIKRRYKQPLSWKIISMTKRCHPIDGSRRCPQNKSIDNITTGQYCSMYFSIDTDVLFSPRILTFAR